MSASDRRAVIAMLVLAGLFLFLFVPAVSSIPVQAMKKVIYDSVGKPLVGGDGDPSGNDIGGVKPVCMRWPSCEDDVSPTPSPSVPNAVSTNTFTSTTSPIAPTVKVEGQPIQEKAPTTATVYKLPDSVSQTGYTNEDGTIGIPAKSQEKTAYETQTGQVLQPVVVTYKQGDTSGMSVGYQSPPPKYAEPGGYWMDGEYIQPSGISYQETLSKQVTEINAPIDGVCMGKIGDIGWGVVDCNTGMVLSVVRPLATVPMLSVIQMS